MEKEMRPMTTEMLKKGYLLFPKALFEEQMNMKTGEKAADAFEALCLCADTRQLQHGDLQRQGTPFRLCTWRVRTFPGSLDGDIGVASQPYALLLQQDVRRRHRGAGGQPLRDAHPYPRL